MQLEPMIGNSEDLVGWDLGRRPPTDPLGVSRVLLHQQFFFSFFEAMRRSIATRWW